MFPLPALLLGVTLNVVLVVIVGLCVAPPFAENPDEGEVLADQA